MSIWKAGQFYIALGGMPFAPWSLRGFVDLRSHLDREQLSIYHHDRSKLVDGEISNDGLFGIHRSPQSGVNFEGTHVLTHLATGMVLCRASESECKRRAALFEDTVTTYHADHEEKKAIPVEPLATQLKALLTDPD